MPVVYFNEQHKYATKLLISAKIKPSQNFNCSLIFASNSKITGSLTNYCTVISIRFFIWQIDKTALPGSDLTPCSTCGFTAWIFRLCYAIVYWICIWITIPKYCDLSHALLETKLLKGLLVKTLSRVKSDAQIIKFALIWLTWNLLIVDLHIIPLCQFIQHSTIISNCIIKFRLILPPVPYPLEDVGAFD